MTRLTPEREKEIRGFTYGPTLQNCVSELLAEIDALRELLGEAERALEEISEMGCVEGPEGWGASWEHSDKARHELAKLRAARGEK